MRSWEDHRIRSAAGEDLTDIGWTLGVSSDVSHGAFAEEARGIGVLPEHGHGVVALGPRSFTTLVDAIAAGHTPTKVEMDVVGMTYASNREVSFQHDADLHNLSVITTVSFSGPMSGARMKPAAPSADSDNGKHLRAIRGGVYVVIGLLIVVALSAVL
jgi:hypothetical protein